MAKTGTALRLWPTICKCSMAVLVTIKAVTKAKRHKAATRTASKAATHLKTSDHRRTDRLRIKRRKGSNTHRRITTARLIRATLMILTNRNALPF